MLFAHYMLLAAGLMPYVLVGAAKAAPGYDNANPRSLDNLGSDKRRRIYAAHLNALEAFPLFAAGVLLATLLEANALATNILSGFWLLLRTGFALAYITDRATLRSLLWLAATAISVALFLISLGGGRQEHDGSLATACEKASEVPGPVRPCQRPASPSARAAASAH